MQRIIPNLWFDDQAEEATECYTQTFANASIGRSMRYNEASAQTAGREPGSVMSQEFVLEGFAFYALNGSFGFEFSPANSFIFKCADRDEIERLWTELSEGGSELMPLDSYDFSECYGWCEDRFGLSWQLMYAPEADRGIVPCLMFVGDRYGSAEDAMDLYTSTLPDSSIGFIDRHGPDDDLHREGTVSFAEFTLYDECFVAMESAGEHDFDFTQAVSYIVQCDDQAEIDLYWEALTSGGGEGQRFGWITDRFGVSWQVVPHRIRTLLHTADDDTVQRITEALLNMNKIDFDELREAAE